MNIATQNRSYPAKQLNASKKKHLSLAAIRQDTSVTHLAKENGVSRKFVYQQKSKAVNAINDVFTEKDDDKNKVLFYIPVTFKWLYQLILALVFHCRANHRGIQKLLLDVFDHNVSLGTIHNVIDDAKHKAKVINDAQDLTPIKLAAQDETYHYNKPVLTGVDIPSLYCYLLSDEQHRDFDTWGTHLLDLKNQGLHPERVFADDADGIHSAHKYVYPDVPYDLDNFHIIKDMMDMRRFFRNSLKSAISNRIKLQNKVDNRLFTSTNSDYTQDLKAAIIHESKINNLSQSIDVLVNWMQHDVLKMPGIEPQSRYELFDFILYELNQLANQYSHRIKSVCTTLKNQKYQLLAFTEVLNTKFQLIADEFVYPVEKIWEICSLQRCKLGGMTYAVRSIPLQDYFQYDFDDVEDAVIKALETTERTSSMVENLHSRLSPYFFLRREIGFGYLDLLRFYLNHNPIQRSAKEERHKKTPTEILTGKSHPHWLDMLGCQRFKKAA